MPEWGTGLSRESPGAGGPPQGYNRGSRLGGEDGPRAASFGIFWEILVSSEPWLTLVRHEGEAPREQSTCGWRDRLISREDAGGTAAWAHAVDIDGAREHYHRRSAELYYVLEGEGFVLLDGRSHAVRKGSIVHIPPGVIHGARGKMRVLVVGVPDIADDDLYFPDEE
jgi:mannose-6-phosphate isomerase-like protein (cupin superfamily)